MYGPRGLDVISVKKKTGRSVMSCRSTGRLRRNTLPSELLVEVAEPSRRFDCNLLGLRLGRLGQVEVENAV
jgi:hypothetical protein